MIVQNFAEFADESAHRPNEVLRVENRLHYNHLDSLFGEDRKEPLTWEDLQLYSIVNEGRKPLMYDFEH